MAQAIGRITNVYNAAAKSELSANVAVGAGAFPVYDAYAFEPSGGIVLLNGVTYAYSSVDLENNILSLTDPSAPLSAQSQDDEVVVVPAGYTKWAMVDLGDGDEGVRALVPFGMRDRLDDGIREEADQESVMLSDASGRWEIVAVDDEIVVITGTVFQTKAEGNRIIMRDDGDAGIIEFFGGTDNELPGSINPQVAAVSPYVPRVVFSTPSVPTDTDSQDAGVATLFSGRIAEGAGGMPSLDVNGNVNADGWVNAQHDVVAHQQLQTGNPPSTTNAVNCRIGSAGILNIVTSLSKHKIDQQPLTLDDVLGILGLTPKTWFDKTEVEQNDGNTDGLRRTPGLIAEDVEEHVPELATYDDAGDLHGVAYDRVAAFLIPIIRDQQARIEALEARLSDSSTGDGHSGA
jgi:hypothetical protein